MALLPGDFAPGVRNQGPRCTVETLLASLPEGDRDVVSSVLDDPRVTHATIARRLRAEGYQIGNFTIGKHRRGECRCGR